MLALLLKSLFAVVAHEEISCMACGQQTEGPESPYTGMCKNADDPGNSTKCNEEEFKSCMTGVISKAKSFIFSRQPKSAVWQIPILKI